MSRKMLMGKGRHSSAPTFTPASLTGLSWWAEVGKGGLFQSNAGTTAAVANSDVVGFLPDQSGNSFTLTSAADDTTRPTLQGVGSFPYLSADGSNDCLRRTASLGPWASGAATWALCYRSAAATSARLFAEGRSSNANPFVIPAEVDNATSTTGKTNIRDDAATGSGGVAANTLEMDTNDHVLIVTWDGTTIRTYVDAVAGATATPSMGSITLDRTSLFALVRTTTANFWAGRFYGGFVCNGHVLSSGERASSFTYLGALAGKAL